MMPARMIETTSVAISRLKRFMFTAAESGRCDPSPQLPARA